MFAAMAAMFVMALAVPEAFDDLEGGLDGPVVIAFAYLAVRVLHLAMFWLTARTEHDRALRGQLLRFAPSLFGSTAMLLVASQLSGTAQTLTWVGALIVDYVGVILGGASGWRLRSASHFAERHGLIVIVALGESIVAIGVGVAGLPISWPIIAGAVLGTRGRGRACGGRTSTSSRSSPSASSGVSTGRREPGWRAMPTATCICRWWPASRSSRCGIEQVLELVGHTTDGELALGLDLLPLTALYGGVALFLFAHVAFKYRTWRHVSVRRLVVGAVICRPDPAGDGVAGAPGARAADRRPRGDDRVRSGPLRRGAGAGPPRGGGPGGARRTRRTPGTPPE